MNFFDDEFAIEYIFNESGRVLNEFYVKLFNNGVTIKDVKALKFYDSKLSELISYYEKIIFKVEKEMNKFRSFVMDDEFESCYEYEVSKYDDLCIEFNKINNDINEINSLKLKINEAMKMCRNNILKKFEREEIKYIIDQTSLLHLIYTNNTYKKIRRYSKDSHMFMCQFHEGEKISFGVTGSINKCHCYKCNFCGNQITYLMSYENLSFIESIYLLAEIYLIEIDNNPLKDNELVKYYRNILISDNYSNYINETIEKIKNKGNIDKLDWYINHLKNINRIKNNCIDETIKNNYKNKPKVYKLDMPTFDN